MRVLPLVNQKGGCGKTTSAVNLAGALSRRGWRVLLVDLDPQAHATLGLGVAARGAGVYEVLADELPIRGATTPIRDGFELLAGAARLAEFEEVAARRLQPERALARALSAHRHAIDFAIVDCPARADGILTANALAAASTAVLVVETGAFALQGALSALEILGEVRERHGARFGLAVLGTLYDGRTRFARELLIALQARFGPLLFDTVVRSSVRLREAAASGQTIQQHAPRSSAAADFEALAGEVEQLETQGAAAAPAWLWPRELDPLSPRAPAAAPVRNPARQIEESRE